MIVSTFLSIYLRYLTGTRYCFLLVFKSNTRYKIQFIINLEIFIYILSYILYFHTLYSYILNTTPFPYFPSIHTHIYIVFTILPILPFLPILSILYHPSHSYHLFLLPILTILSILLIL